MIPCIFCDILGGKIPSTPVYQDDHVYAFADIKPVAPVHILIVPRLHVASVMDVPETHWDLFGKIHAAAQKIIRKQGLDKAGFRLVVNNGADAGQAVNHLHYHLLAGRRLGWPPG